MSHNRRNRVVHELVVSATGTAELLREGNSVWLSDDDADLADEIGSDFINASNIGKVLDYLVDIGMLSDAQADDCFVVEHNRAANEDDNDDDDDDGDEPLEGEYIPAEETPQ
jgi:hypothetical protein